MTESPLRADGKWRSLDSRPMVEEAGGPLNITDARTILAQCLQTSGAEPSAHEADQQEHDRWEAIVQLAAEYGAIAQAARPLVADVAGSQHPGMAAIRQAPCLILGLIPMAQEPVRPSTAMRSRTCSAGLRPVPTGGSVMPSPTASHGGQTSALA